jgi:hypothetical protein
MSLWTKLACIALLAASPACKSDDSRVQRAQTGDWRYELESTDDGDLDVSASIPAGAEVSLVADRATAGFLRGVEGLRTRENGGWTLPASSSERRARWHFLANEAAREIDDIDVAALRGGSFVGSLSAFLLRADAGSARCFVHWKEQSERRFACALEYAGDLEWLGRAGELDVRPACVFGAITVSQHTLDGVSLELAQIEQRDVSRSTELVSWLFDSERGVAAYFGRFPVDRLLLTIAPSRRRSIGDGRSRGFGGAAMYVAVNRNADAREFRRDWVLTHEMIHLALPSLEPMHHWAEEGSATYLEPLLRARTGRASEEDVWRSILDEYGQGLPEPGDRGLDHTHTWGRTYYGGAIYWLTCDVEIRARTENQKSLQDALAAVLASGGNIEKRWPFARVIEIGDRATGTNVLAETYERMKDSPEPRELDSTWKQLGVALVNGRVELDDSAPLAFVRKELVLGRH